jgi:hypothetical protein
MTSSKKRSTVDRIEGLEEAAHEIMARISMMETCVDSMISVYIGLSVETGRIDLIRELVVHMRAYGETIMAGDLPNGAKARFAKKLKNALLQIDNATMANSTPGGDMEKAN